jgi:hypothetical protein
MWRDAPDVHALDIAKRLMDYNFHPPTNYFPLIVHEALMIEPTETESKQTWMLSPMHCSKSRKKRAPTRTAERMPRTYPGWPPGRSQSCQRPGICAAGFHPCKSRKPEFF